MTGGNFRARRPALLLLSGLPGSGKTTFARALAETLSFEHVESDAVRRALRLSPNHTPEENVTVFSRVESAARAALLAGRHALIDATNLTHRDRKRFLRLATELGAPMVAVRVVAPEATIRERLAAPRSGFSQASVEIYDRMRGRAQPFSGPLIAVDSRFPLGPSIDLVLRLIHDGG